MGNINSINDRYKLINYLVVKNSGKKFLLYIYLLDDTGELIQTNAEEINNVQEIQLIETINLDNNVEVDIPEQNKWYISNNNLYNIIVSNINENN